MSYVKEVGKGYVPDFVSSGLQFEVEVGSKLYGTQVPDSDTNVLGWYMPPKHHLFPHLSGYIEGFSKKDITPQHHATTLMANGTVYNFTFYNVAKFIRLCINFNPSIIDTLFADSNVHISTLGKKVIGSRGMFLSKQLLNVFIKYSASQLNEIENSHLTDLVKFRQYHSIKNDFTVDQLTKIYFEGDKWLETCPWYFEEENDLSISTIGTYLTLLKKCGSSIGKTGRLIEKYGYDTTAGYHVVRLLMAAEQLITTGVLDYSQFSSTLVEIAEGVWKEDDITLFFNRKKKELNDLVKKSSLPDRVNEYAVNNLLLNLIEEHYGTIS